MDKPKLTIFTDPMPVGVDLIPETARRILRRIKYTFVKRSHASHPYYRGHSAVTRSLVEGLKKNGASFNYNPKRLKDVSETAHVLADVKALRQIIRLKKEGLIKQLSAGPNAVSFGTGDDDILASPEIDLVVTHCDWSSEFWACDHPDLLDRSFNWSAGVDTDYWQPKGHHQDRVLIFDKRSKDDSYARIKPYVDFLQSQGWPVDVLVRSKKQGYTHEQYRELLHQSTLMVGFTVGSESQGLAWSEAWAANVPTLILRQTENVYRGRRFRCSTAPFLTDQTGLFFDDLNDFKEQFAYWQSHREQFAPRDWVMENMSDEVCAAKLYKRLTEV